MTILLPASLLILLPLASRAQERPLGQHQVYIFPDNDIVHNCQFRIADREYDLCPVLRRSPFTIDPPRWRGQASAVYTFDFNRQPLGTESSGGKCPDSAWICMTVTPPSSPISEAVPIAASNAAPGSCLLVQSSQMANAPLILHLTGALQSQSTRITFICDPAVDTSIPEFVGYTHGVHSFKWTTKHACGSPPSSGISVLQEVPPDNPDGTADPSESPDDQDLVGSGSAKIPPRRWAAMIIFFFGSLIILTAALIYNPPRQFIEAYVKPLASHMPNLPLPRVHLPFSLHGKRSRFRVEEESLVLWAQEDMVLGEEDVMVNGMEDGFDEESIPLTNVPGMSRGRIIRNYGSAQFR